MKTVGVQCRQVRLSYGSTEVLRAVDLEVVPGEFFALLGPSGSGKSTLLRLIAGFNRADSGAVLIDGIDVSMRQPWERNVGMVFQNYALWPHMSVWDNVAFGLVERRVDRPTIRAKVSAALEMVGLGAFAARRPNQLSGGQQQRVALARTLVIEPQVLLLDEPLSNLDKALRVQMREELLAMQRRLGLTTIFVTHDQEEAMTTADRMAVLDHGVVQQVGTPAELYDRPVNAFVAGFVGTTNLLPCAVGSAATDTLGVDVEGLGGLRVEARCAAPGVAAGQRAVLALRPQALRLAGPADSADSAQGHGLAEAAFEGVVQTSEFLGGVTRYRVRVGSQVMAVDQPYRSDGPRVAAGSTVGVVLDLGQARLLAG